MLLGQISNTVTSLCTDFNPSSANFTKSSNTLKQFVGVLPTNGLSVFDHFVGLALKGLINILQILNVIIKVILYTCLLPHEIYNFMFNIYI